MQQCEKAIVQTLEYSGWKLEKTDITRDYDCMTGLFVKRDSLFFKYNTRNYGLFNVTMAITVFPDSAKGVLCSEHRATGVKYAHDIVYDLTKSNGIAIGNLTVEKMLLIWKAEAIEAEIKKLSGEDACLSPDDFPSMNDE